MSHLYSERQPPGHAAGQGHMRMYVLAASCMRRKLTRRRVEPGGKHPRISEISIEGLRNGCVLSVSVSKIPGEPSVEGTLEALQKLALNAAKACLNYRSPMPDSKQCNA